MSAAPAARPAQRQQTGTERESPTGMLQPSLAASQSVRPQEAAVRCGTRTQSQALRWEVQASQAASTAVRPPLLNAF